MIPQSALYDITPQEEKLNGATISAEGVSIPRHGLNEESLENFIQMQGLFSSDNFFDKSWQIELTASKRTGTIKFPILSKEDGIILRAVVVQHLIQYGSIESGRRIVRDSIPFFEFLKERKINIEYCRSILIDSFTSYLEADSTLNNSKRNGIMRAVATLADFCVQHQIIQGTGVIDCSKRYPEDKKPARAPDACVILRLDTLFFDESNDIPNAYRCIYLLLRLIPNRVGEILEMDIDCISFPALGCYAIRIPTYKETTYHTLEYNEYNRKIDGWCEGILFRTLSKQQKLAANKHLSGINQGYLFVAPQKDTVITANDFNSYLKSLIKEHQILDESGKLAEVTSHSLRHVTIGERLRGNVVTPIQTMLESNHRTLDQTMGYGHQSPHDEAMHLKEILNDIRNSDSELSENKNNTITPKEMSKEKYMRLQSQAYTRIIPGEGICCDTTCVPRYEECFKCPHFEPAPEYLEYFKSSITYLKEKVETLKQRHGDPKAIQYNQQQIDVLQSIVDRLRSRMP